jgi:hypothetical protein
MSKIIKTLTLFFLTCTFFFSIISAVPAREKVVDLTIKGETLSAKLKEVPLKDILEKLERELGIWFKGDESEFAEMVSVQFKNLSLEDGLRRILAFKNYSLLFDRDTGLVGVIVLGKSGKTTHSSKALKGHVAGGSEFKDVQGSSSLGNTGSAPVKMKVITNSPPPKNSNAKPIEGKIIKNSPPPENHNAQHIDMTIKKNSPPPGNPNAKTIDTTIIKNSPPPGN